MFTICSRSIGPALTLSTPEVSSTHSQEVPHLACKFYTSLRPIRELQWPFCALYSPRIAHSRFIISPPSLPFKNTYQPQSAIPYKDPFSTRMGNGWRRPDGSMQAPASTRPNVHRSRKQTSYARQDPTAPQHTRNLTGRDVTPIRAVAQRAHPQIQKRSARVISTGPGGTRHRVIVCRLRYNATRE